MAKRKKTSHTSPPSGAGRIDKTSWRQGDLENQNVALVGRHFPLAVIDHALSGLTARFESAINRMASIATHADLVGKREQFVQLRSQGAMTTALVPYTAIPGRGGMSSSDADRWARGTGMYRSSTRNMAGLTEHFTTITPKTLEELGAPSGTYPEIQKGYELVTAKQAKIFREEDAKAESKHRLERSIGTRKKTAAYIYDMMDDYQRTFHDYRVKYGTRQRAENMMREDVIKKLPAFMQKSIRNSGITAKTLTTIAKNPIGSKLLLGKGGFKGLALMGAAAVYAADQFFKKSDQANTNVSQWQNAINLYGRPSKSFSDAAYKAGYKDPGQIAKLHGQLTMLFGNADLGVQILGEALKDAPDIARMSIAKSLGLDENAMALIDILSGRLSVGDIRKTMAATNKQEVWKQMGYSSEGSFADTVRAIGSEVPGVSGSSARTNQDAIEKHYERIENQLNEAINSAEEFRRTPNPISIDSSSNSGKGGRGGDTYVINGDINVSDVKDAKGLISDVQAQARKSVLVDNSNMED